jgi:enoyl-CoA hydratase/carnithine racemase
MTVIKSSRDGAVATLTIDNAAQGNLLSVETLRELASDPRGGRDRRQGDRAALRGR